MNGRKRIAISLRKFRQVGNLPFQHLGHLAIASPIESVASSAVTSKDAGPIHRTDWCFLVRRFGVRGDYHGESFVTMLMEASTLAVRNHQKEKIDALRNAVLNSAIKSPDDYLQGVLLQFVAIATPWHFKVLQFYNSPSSYLEKAGIEPETGALISNFVEHIFPELKGKEAFRLQIERDLLHYGLILPESAWYTERTTNTGDQLLKQIEFPEGV